MKVFTKEGSPEPAQMQGSCGGPRTDQRRHRCLFFARGEDNLKTIAGARRYTGTMPSAAAVSFRTLSPWPIAVFMEMEDGRPRAEASERSHTPAADPAEGTDDNAQADIARMQRVRDGDRDAFAELVECHQARVIGTVARMLGPDAAADAEDIAQQVFLRVWKSAARYEPTAKFTTWLYTITRNLVFNELRRRKSRPMTSFDAPAPSGESAAATAPIQFEDRTAVTPDATLLEAELQDAITAAMDALPETQRMALILRRYEELPYEDIARVLDLTVPAVKSVLFRARTELREKLARYLEG